MKLHGFAAAGALAGGIAIAALLMGASPVARGEEPTIQERLYRHMSSMPADSVTRRHAFTRADSITREYIVKQFAACGLEPLSREKGYLQPFPVIRRTRVLPESRVVISAKGHSRSMKTPDDFVVRDRSGNGAVSGGVAFIGYGIQAPESGYDDFSKVDFTGKTVICYSSPPTHIDMSLRKMSWRLSYMKQVALIDSLGGSAVVFVSPASYAKTCNVLHAFDESRVRFMDRHGKPAGIPVLNMTNEVLARMMHEAGIDLASVDRELETASASRAFVIPGAEISMDVAIERISADAFNILGLLQGRDTTRTIVVGAHYDGPTFVDNASGVAEVLELARLCAERGPFDCNILFAAFGLEEMMCVGSKHFTANIPPRIGAIKAMLNFDVIGRIRGDTLCVGHVQTAGEWEKFVSRLDSRGLEIVSEPRIGGSDSGPFSDAGIPTFWFLEVALDDVHIRDSLDAMNLDGMERALRYAFDFLTVVTGDGTTLGTPVRERAAFRLPDSTSQGREDAHE